MIAQQLVSSIPQNVLTRTSYKRKEQVKGTQRKTVTFEDQDQKGEEAEQNLGQEILSGRRTLKITGELINKTRDKKVCPGSQV